MCESSFHTMTDMKRFIKLEKNYVYSGITAFLVIAASIVFYMLLRYLPVLRSAFAKLMQVLSPFIWGLAITYLLSPLMKVFEKMFSGKRLKKIKIKSRAVRVWAILLSEIVLLIILGAFVSLIIPQLYSSVETIVINSPEYFSRVTAWIGTKLQDYPEAEKYVSAFLENFNTSLLDLVKNQLLPSLGNVVTSVTSGVFTAVKSVYNLIIGIIVSVYVLSNREGALAGARKVLYSLFDVETAENLRKGLSFVDKTFMGFLSGKLLDSAIIGALCYVVCGIANMPYALLVSVIVGVTNIIPFFGPFIGAIPSAFIILLVSPLKCLLFIVFIIILQQLDGNIIGPKILGSSIGINGFWIMFAIILGGGLFGFFGMLLGVPVFVVLYTAIAGVVNAKLKRSELPQDSASYIHLDHIDPETKEVHSRK